MSSRTQRVAIAALIGAACACDSGTSDGATPAGGTTTPSTQGMAGTSATAGASASPVSTPAVGSAGASSAETAAAGAASEPPMQPSTPMEPMANDPPATNDPPPKDPPPAASAAKRIYWLDILGNGVYTARADGSEPMRIATALASPDGVVADDCAGRIFFTNMGSALGGSGQASVQSWDGTDTKTLIEPGSGIDTAKQMTWDALHQKLYVADREGAKIWRAEPDGSGLTVLVQDHGFDQLVGVAVDAAGGHVYFTDRNLARVHRMGLEMPQGQTASDRDDVETLYQAASGAMLIDLALDLDARALYLTDRQLGTVQRMGMDMPAGATASTRDDVEVVIDRLTEPIGVAVDVAGDALYVTELGGQVHRAHLDGGGDAVIASAGSATGIAVSVIDDLSQPLTCE